MTTPQPGQPFSGRTIWIRNLKTPLREFLRTETGGASVLLSAAIVALVWVNVDASSYDALWGTTLSIDVGGAGVVLDLRHWVNSGLMTFFFFVLGLEARREFDLGELRERRRFALLLLAAIGGMATAVAIYLALSGSRPRRCSPPWACSGRSSSCARSACVGASSTRCSGRLYESAVLPARLRGQRYARHVA